MDKNFNRHYNFMTHRLMTIKSNVIIKGISNDKNFLLLPLKLSNNIWLCVLCKKYNKNVRFFILMPFYVIHINPKQATLAKNKYTLTMNDVSK